MKAILPNNEMGGEERKLRNHQKRIIILEYVSDILMIVVGISVLIMVWTAINKQMSEKAYDKGYDTGFDSCIQENNLYDRYDNAYREPATDAEIWETYHDCNMYGLPSYARPYCEKEVPNA